MKNPPPVFKEGVKAMVRVMMMMMIPLKPSFLYSFVCKAVPIVLSASEIIYIYLSLWKNPMLLVSLVYRFLFVLGFNRVFSSSVRAIRNRERVPGTFS